MCTACVSFLRPVYSSVSTAVLFPLVVWISLPLAVQCDSVPSHMLMFVSQENKDLA